MQAEVHDFQYYAALRSQDKRQRRCDRREETIKPVVRLACRYPWWAIAGIASFVLVFAKIEFFLLDAFSIWWSHI